MKKILIVEDERILAVSLKMDLQGFGYQEITLATNFSDAVNAVESGQADLVLMDISIAGEQNGIDTARKIAEISPIPVVYLTGEADESTRARAESVSNCKGYLLKPVNLGVLAPLLEELLP